MTLNDEYQIMLHTTRGEWMPVTPILYERPTDSEMLKIRTDIGLRNDIRLFKRKWDEVNEK